MEPEFETDWQLEEPEPPEQHNWEPTSDSGEHFEEGAADPDEDAAAEDDAKFEEEEE